MKKIVVLICLLIPFFSNAQHAMHASSSYTNFNSRDLFWTNAALSTALQTDVPGARKKHNGSLLMVSGGVLFASGTVVLLLSDKSISLYLNEQKSNGTLGKANQQAEAGVLLMVGGLGMFVPGIIIYSKGNRQYNAHKAENTVSMHLHGAGVGLRWKL